MKKLLLCGFLVANIMMLTSCLDGNNNSENSAWVVGYTDLDYNTFRTVVYTSDFDYPMYITNLGTSINSGECCIFHCTIRSEDNPDYVTAGYYNVTGREYSVIPPLRAKGLLTDTATVLENEMATTLLTFNNSVKGFIFLTSTHENVGDKQENDYELSYNFNQEPEIINGENVYNLFFRAVKKKDGTSPTIQRDALNAFSAQDFLKHMNDTEKSKGKDYYYYRFNYIKSFNKDSVPTWDTSMIVKWDIPKDAQ